jgi:signal transduction histidine kinase
MMTQTYPDAVDTRLVFKVYAIIAWIGGFALFAWGVLLFGIDLPGVPYGLAVPIRVTGGIIMGVGCLAKAMANVEDPVARRRGLFWFVVGHTIVLAVVIMQLIGVWGDPSAAGKTTIGVLITVICILGYFWQTGDQPRSVEWQEFTQLFMRAQDRPAIAQLRSEYEDRLRDAAGQEERNRLARELHDSIKQQIFVIQTAAATAEARFGADAAGTKQAIEQVRSSAREAMTEMEVMLDQLRAAPLENVGLLEALKKQCEALAFRTGATVDFTPGTLPPPEALPPRAQQTVFRVAQEALANVARHARASHVRVMLATLETGALQLKVEDDGKGFDPSATPRGMGLSNMETRAAEVGGSVTVKSHAGGTMVALAIPTRRPADWGEYRRRIITWSITSGFFVLMVALGVIMKSRRDSLVMYVPFLVLDLVVLARAVVAYRRARKRIGAALWEESTLHS